MGVDLHSGFGVITGIYVAVAAVAAPLISIYVHRRTKDATMKKDNCWYDIKFSYLHFFLG